MALVAAVAAAATLAAPTPGLHRVTLKKDAAAKDIPLRERGLALAAKYAARSGKFLWVALRRRGRTSATVLTECSLSNSLSEGRPWQRLFSASDKLRRRAILW